MTTVQNLFDNYKGTREYQKLAKNSKATYDSQMRFAVNDYFLVRNRLTQITETVVDELYEKIKIKSVQQANMFMRVMRRIWSVGKRKGWTKTNPFIEMGLETVKPRTNRWTKTDYEVYINKTTELKYYDLRAIAAYCYVLAQRPGDIAALTIKNFRNDLTEVSFIQQKTKKEMHLPIIGDLTRYAKAAFSIGDKLINTHLRILNEQHREVLKLTGLPPDLQLRDLRRTALMEVMENDGTDAEGQALSGHKDRAMLDIYAPSSLKMAVNALHKRNLM